MYFDNKIVEYNFTNQIELKAALGDPTTYNGQSVACYTHYEHVMWIPNLDNPQIFDLDDWQDKDLDWTVEVTGHISIPSCYYEHVQGNVYSLKKRDEEHTGHEWGGHIYFTLTNGASSVGSMVVTAVQKDYLGKAYSCTYTININKSIKSVKWDFYSKHLTPNTTNYTWKEEDVSGSGDKLNAYKADITSATDLSAQISETSGLKFIAPKYTTAEEHYTFGYKDPDPSGTTTIDNRYIGLHQGATLIIPHERWSHHEGGGNKKTRIRIKMGRYGSTSIHLTITNAQDALGNDIATTAGDYKIGGSAWWGDKGDNHQRGEYHFIVKDKNQDFTIKVENTGGTWLKLYTIEVYESEDLITENSVLGTRYQLLNSAGTIGNPGAFGSYYLHYRGKGEGTSIAESTITISGHITTEGTYAEGAYKNDGTTGFDHLSVTPADESGSPTHRYTSKIGDYGTFGMRIACYTHGNTYCTDYSTRRQSVGYMASQSYPYTWDFTDVKTYCDIGTNRIFGYGTGESEQSLSGSGLQLWTVNEGISQFGLRLSPNAGYDVMYCGGSQLWYGSVIIPELAGLAFTPVNFDKTYNNAMIIEADGLKFDQELRDWWGWRVTVPAVPAGGAVYIHATKDRSDSFYGVKYYVGASVNNKTNMTPFAAGNVAGTDLKVANQIGGSSNGDNVVYAVCNQGGSAQDITLFFNGVTVHKMAVSTDLKAVNKYGWTTESRPHDIDPELTSYMTGQNFKNFLVTGADYSAKRVTMTPIANNTVIPAAGTDVSPASGNGSPNAYIIQNTAGSTVDIVNGGFHLFAPDMHESDEVSSGVRRKPYVDTSSSLLKAQVTATTNGTKIQPKTTDGGTTYTNYAFTYKHWNLDADGNKTGTMMEGPQAFYRIANGGASSIGNQAYLPVVSEQAGEARGFYMDFGEDEDPGSYGTAVEVVKSTVTKSDVYYNLNGQQMNGKPAKGGIYIHNGKKVVIK